MAGEVTGVHRLGCSLPDQFLLSLNGTNTLKHCKVYFCDLDSLLNDLNEVRVDPSQSVYAS